MSRGSIAASGPLTRAVAAILSEAFAELLTTQQRFGLLVGMSKPTVSRTLDGQRPLTLEQLHVWCAALGIDALEVHAAAIRITTR